MIYLCVCDILFNYCNKTTNRKCNFSKLLYIIYFFLHFNNCFDNFDTKSNCITVLRFLKKTFQMNDLTFVNISYIIILTTKQRRKNVRSQKYYKNLQNKTS